MKYPSAIAALLSCGLVAAPLAACEQTIPASSVEEIANFDPEFRIRKIAMAPDSSGFAIAGRKGEVAVIEFETLAMTEAETGIAKPTSLEYAPDGGELWISARRGASARLDPKEATRLSGDLLGRFMVGETSVSTTELGQYTLEADGKRTEAFGRILIDPKGKAALDNALLIANAPDRLIKFAEGKTAGDAKQDPKPVGEMTVACGGKCLLTAENSGAAETYFWSLEPFDPNPTRLIGRFFGERSVSCDGDHALLVTDAGLIRISLPPEPGLDGPVHAMDPQALTLSPDGSYAHALIRQGDLDEYGWSVFDAATMEPVATPDWLDEVQARAVIGPKGQYGLFVGEGKMHLVSVPFEPIRTFDVDPEMANAAFSDSGALLAIRQGNDVSADFAIHRSADGKALAVVSGKNVVFSPDDRYLIALGDSVRVYRIEP